MSDYLIVIKADHNDADYVYKMIEVSAKEYKEVKKLLVKISEALRNCKEDHNWPNSEYVDGTPEKLYKGILTDSEIDSFDDSYIPYSEYGIHTIESIEVFPIKKKQKLF